MKCPSCGTGLHIENEKCPFCGNANPFYKEHRKEMGRYKEEFEDTKEKVYKKSHFFTGFTVQITAIAVLVAIESVLLFANSNMWAISGKILDYRAEKNYEEYTAKIREYEEAEDYQKLLAYIDLNSLSYKERYEEFYAIYGMCMNYNMARQYMMRLIHEDKYSFVSEDESIRYICDYIGNFYKRAVPDTYSDEKAYSGIHAATIEKLRRDMELLLITYGQLTPEEAGEFEHMSIAKKQLILERGLIENED